MNMFLDKENKQTTDFADVFDIYFIKIPSDAFYYSLPLSLLIKH